MAVELRSWAEFESEVRLKDFLETQITELQYRLFDGESPIHVVYKSNEEPSDCVMWAFFQSDWDLERMDLDALSVSEDFNGCMCIYDLDNMILQGYDSGEYDTGVFSQPAGREMYMEYVRKALSQADAHGQFPFV